MKPKHAKLDINTPRFKKQCAERNHIQRHSCSKYIVADVENHALLVILIYVNEKKIEKFFEKYCKKHGRIRAIVNMDDSKNC